MTSSRTLAAPLRRIGLTDPRRLAQTGRASSSARRDIASGAGDAQTSGWVWLWTWAWNRTDRTVGLLDAVSLMHGERGLVSAPN